MLQETERYQIRFNGLKYCIYDKKEKKRLSGYFDRLFRLLDLNKSRNEFEFYLAQKKQPNLYLYHIKERKPLVQEPIFSLSEKKFRQLKSETNKPKAFMKKSGPILVVVFLDELVFVDLEEKKKLFKDKKFDGHFKSVAVFENAAVVSDYDGGHKSFQYIVDVEKKKIHGPYEKVSFSLEKKKHYVFVVSDSDDRPRLFDLRREKFLFEKEKFKKIFFLNRRDEPSLFIGLKENDKNSLELHFLDAESEETFFVYDEKFETGLSVTRNDQYKVRETNVSENFFETVLFFKDSELENLYFKFELDRKTKKFRLKSFMRGFERIEFVDGLDSLLVVGESSDSEDSGFEKLALIEKPNFSDSEVSEVENRKIRLSDLIDQKLNFITSAAKAFYRFDEKDKKFHLIGEALFEEMLPKALNQNLLLLETLDSKYVIYDLKERKPFIDERLSSISEAEKALFKVFLSLKEKSKASKKPLKNKLL